MAGASFLKSRSGWPNRVSASKCGRKYVSPSGFIVDFTATPHIRRRSSKCGDHASTSPLLECATTLILPPHCPGAACLALDGTSCKNAEMRLPASKCDLVRQPTQSPTVPDAMAALRQRVRELEAQARGAEALAHDAELKAGTYESERQQALGRAERELHARVAALQTAERRLSEERRVLEQQRRALCKLPNSKHRAQVEELQKQLEQERKESRAREARRSVAEGRLREQVTALKEELAHLSKTEGKPAARPAKSSGVKNDPVARKAAQILPREHSCKVAPRSGCGNGGAGPRTPPAHTASQARTLVGVAHPTSLSPPPTALPPKECLVKRFACGRRMVHLDGSETLIFDNGDEQHSTPGGVTEYYYAENQTWQRSHSNGVEVVYHPSGRTEAHWLDGSVEVMLACGAAIKVNSGGEVTPCTVDDLSLVARHDPPRRCLDDFASGKP